jgi:hypothetical protein
MVRVNFEKPIPKKYLPALFMLGGVGKHCEADCKNCPFTVIGLADNSICIPLLADRMLKYREVEP